MSATVENYEQAIEFLFNRINYERVAGGSFSASDFKLDRMREFLNRIGNPQQRIPVVHIAGTKGKGSTSAMLAGVLTAAGYRTGLFTSPHISAFEERMAVDGRLPTQTQLVELVNSLLEVIADLDKSPGRMSPTYFEIATALAWQYFQQQQVQMAVLEVGLGGRLDATNICRPELTIITTISRDHTRQLGSRVGQIAGEKAGIAKPGVPMISGVSSGEAAEVIRQVCQQVGSPLVELGHDFQYAYHPSAAGSSVGEGREVAAGGAAFGHSDSVTVTTARQSWPDLPLALLGEHQAHNAAVVVTAVEQLRERGWRIPDSAVAQGLSQVRWPGRIEVLSQAPVVIVDAAHNWAAVQALLKTLDDRFPQRRRVLIFAATQDKDVRGLLRLLLPRCETIILTSYQNNPRGMPVDQLLRLVRGLCDLPVHAVGDPVAAWKLAKHIARPDDLICITGSFFIAAELRELILDENRLPAGLLLRHSP